MNREPWQSRPESRARVWGRRLLLAAVILGFLLLARLVWGTEIVSVSLSTNRPAVDFTAASGATAYWQSSNRCHTVTFTIHGEPGEAYTLQWNRGLNSPHGFLNVFQPITNTTGTAVVSFPMIQTGDLPASVWRLRRF